MKHVLLPAFGAILLAAAPAAAGPRAVVELFTSQACASCPPADAKLVELARDPDLIALTLPVDYWDYLGWADTLADPAHSARQRAYAELRGDRKVFTPQMVVNGAVACVGSKAEEVADALGPERRAGPGLPVAVSVAVVGGALEIRVGAGEARRGPADVLLLSVSSREEVAIGRGENGGRTVVYANVVRSIERIGTWTGEPLGLSAPVSARGDGHVVLVQEDRGGRPGRILGAGRDGPGS